MTRISNAQPHGRRRVACCDQYDGLCCVVRHQPGSHFLVTDIRNLSVENPEFSPGACRDIQLGVEPFGHVDVLNARGKTGAKLDILAVWAVRRRGLDFFLLFRT